MKASELRIGNYVPLMGIETVISINEQELGRSHTGGVIEITSENFTRVLKDIDRREGIPLSEYWLIRFGFKQGDYDFEKGYIKYNRELSNYGCEFENSNFWIVPNGDDDYYRIPIKLQYVHQLQNLYFAINGEELIDNQSA